MASLAGPTDPNEKTDAQKDFIVVSKALTQYAERIGATRFDPEPFPARSGLAAGAECSLVE
jgi:hypothetical protein